MQYCVYPVEDAERRLLSPKQTGRRSTHAATFNVRFPTTLFHKQLVCLPPAVSPWPVLTLMGEQLGHF